MLKAAQPKTPHAKTAAPSVDLYTTASCPYCEEARSFMRANGVSFREYDVENDGAAYERYRSQGGRGVPFAIIGGAAVSGYSSERYRQLLGLP